MANQKMVLTLIMIVSCCLVTYQAIADERGESDAHRNDGYKESDVRENVGQPAENARVGVLNRIDWDNNLLVIDDMIFSFSPRQLAVYRAGLVSSMRSLRPNQSIRYNNASRHIPQRSGNRVSAGRTNRVITNIWIE